MRLAWDTALHLERSVIGIRSSIQDYNTPVFYMVMHTTSSVTRHRVPFDDQRLERDITSAFEHQSPP